MEYRRDAWSTGTLKEFHENALSPLRARRTMDRLPYSAFMHSDRDKRACSARYAPWSDVRLSDNTRLSRPLIQWLQRFLGALLLTQSSIRSVLLIAALALPVPLHAAFDFFSINENAAVMYDAPSLKAGKLYVASLHLPVEAVVKVEGWVKVRDSKGNLAWVEEKILSDKRYVIVTVPLAEAYQAPNTSSPLVFKAQQDVVMEWLEPAANGWVKVRHRDGQTGYVKTTQVWGS